MTMNSLARHMGAACVLVSALVFSACAGDEPEVDEARTASCVTNTSQACACQDGRSGAQVCLADGTFGACVCQGGLAHDMGTGAPDQATSGDMSPGTGRDMGSPMKKDMSACVPDCSGRSCGMDPVCGTSCGRCEKVNLCSASGLCELSPNRLTIRVDGVEVAWSTNLYVKSYDVSHDNVSAGFTLDGVTLGVQKIAERTLPILADCQADAGSGRWTSASAILSTSTIPLNWRGIFLAGHLCGMATDVGTITRWDVTVSQLSQTYMRASFEAEVEGAGPREGEVLTISADMDTPLDPM